MGNTKNANTIKDMEENNLIINILFNNTKRLIYAHNSLPFSWNLKSATQEIMHRIMTARQQTNKTILFGWGFYKPHYL